MSPRAYDMNYLAILVGSVISWISKLFGFGSGATWPGEAALFLSPHILHHLVKRIRKGIIIVAGTNGKTTTTAMIEKILADEGQSVIHNTSGANLLNGVVSAFLDPSVVLRRSVDYAVFEVDENSLPGVLSNISPGNKLIVVLLNLFRDQLDRYGEVDTIAKKWSAALVSVPDAANVLMNADDPMISFIGSQLHARTSYFGLNDSRRYLPYEQHATDTIYCPQCGQKLTFAGKYFSHLGKWTCGKCSLGQPDAQLSAKDVSSPLEGVYNIYNTLAATLVGKTIGINADDIAASLHTFTPAFGRMESIRYKEKNVRILLSKNPTGMNESIRTVLSSQHKGPLLILLNDRIPDGTDVSWIWDVDFEELAQFDKSIIVSGDRALDMVLRLKYGITNKSIDIRTTLKDAVDAAIEKTAKNETLWILPTYSAMLDVRKILTGRKIL